MSGVAATAAVLLPAPRASVDDVAVLPGLFVPEASQWLTTTSGRVALDGYSWMQAVHWVAGAGVYEPRPEPVNVIKAGSAVYRCAGIV
ncbi:hypothetical protein ACODT4_43910 [Streptomyces sp. 2.9]|uniref:hypothetical protein n=1 Tax=Streptomyces tritrimontium TaxID=3406573 RepID=UPI003BB56417